MCEFPSWIIDKDGRAHWLVDHDITQAMEDGKLVKGWIDSTGHSAIEQVLGIKGEHKEGREGLPKAFASDIRTGKCNQMARVEPMHALKYVRDLLPPGLQLFGSKHGGSLYLCGCDLKGITLPTTIGGSLDLRGCDLKGITLPTTIGGSLDLRGCDLKGITLPTTIGGYLDLGGSKNITLPVGLTIGGNLDLTHTDVESLPYGFSIKGEIIGKRLPIPPKDEPKKKRSAKRSKGHQ